MKVIEALKQIKYLAKKSEDLQGKIQLNCADMEFNTPLFPDMRSKMREWLQAHTDVVREICSLKYRIQKTNVLTKLTIQLDGNDVTHTIYEWIQRRKDYCKMELAAWNKLTDRGCVDSRIQQPNGTVAEAKMRRYYDPEEKEKKTKALSQEPFLIDAALEMINCTTDLLD